MSLAAYPVMEARGERCAASCQGGKEGSKGDGGRKEGGGRRWRGGGEGGREERGVGNEGREGFRG
jgi:hypothetical protein